jgi:hypothetical protein
VIGVSEELDPDNEYPKGAYLMCADGARTSAAGPLLLPMEGSMDRRNDRHTVQDSDNSPPSEAWLFAQAILGKPIPRVASREANVRADREFQDFVASISPEYNRRLQDEQAARAAAAADRELLQWAAQISARAQRQLEQLLAAEAEARESQQRAEAFLEALHAQEAYWDPSKHPRLGHDPNAGWFAMTGGTAGGAANQSVGRQLSAGPPSVKFQTVGYKRPVRHGRCE